MSPVQTDVVNRVLAWAWRTQLEHPFVVLEGRAPIPPGKTTLGLGHLLEGGVGGQAEHAVLAAQLAPPA